MSKSKDNTPTIISAIAIGVTITGAYIALVANVAATSFKSGYLAHFGIDIRNVDYWPTIPDLMNEPIVVFLSILVLVLICYLVTVIMNGLYILFHKSARKKGWKRLLSFFDEKPYGWKLTIGVLIALMLFLSFKIPLYDSRDRGLEAAKEQTSFAVVVSENTEKQVLVYQNGDTGLFKIYNAETKSFSGAYEQLNMFGLKLQQVKLIED